MPYMVSNAIEFFYFGTITNSILKNLFKILYTVYFNFKVKPISHLGTFFVRHQCKIFITTSSSKNQGFESLIIF